MPIKTVSGAFLAARFPKPPESKRPPDLKGRVEEAPVVQPNLEVRDSTDESKLNQTEKRFLDILRGRNYSSIRIHAFTLKLADDCRYTPDFSAIVNGRLVFFEVKGGFMREDGWIKVKSAARQFREFDFVLAKYHRKEWTETEVRP
jgi:hypothetical protein